MTDFVIYVYDKPESVRELPMQKILHLIETRLSTDFSLRVNKKEEISIEELAKGDVILVSESLVAEELSKESSLSLKPIVFVSTTSGIESIPPLFPNLFGVIQCEKDNDLVSWGIPSRIVHPIDVNCILEHKVGGVLEKKEKKEVEALFVVDPNLSTYTLRQILEVINHSPEIKTTICSEKEELKTLRPYLNSHVIFKSIDEVDINSFELVIGAGQWIIDAMSRGRMALVLGRKGLGGLVTLENYNALKQYGFEGRPGASINELIPYDLLIGEIKDLLNREDLDYLEELRDLVLEDYSSEQVVVQIKKIITDVLTIAASQREYSKFVKLYPFLGNNFFNRQKDDEQYTLRGRIGTCLSAIDEGMMELLSLCKGEESVEDIIKNSEYGDDALPVFVENLIELWNLKLVTFSAVSSLKLHDEKPVLVD